MSHCKPISDQPVRRQNFANTLNKICTRNPTCRPNNWRQNGSNRNSKAKTILFQMMHIAHLNLQFHWLLLDWFEQMIGICMIFKICLEGFVVVRLMKDVQAIWDAAMPIPWALFTVPHYHEGHQRENTADHLECFLDALASLDSKLYWRCNYKISQQKVTDISRTKPPNLEVSA